MRDKIMIYGWYDGMNLGDDAMMLSINNFLKKNNKDVIYYNFKNNKLNYFNKDLGKIKYIDRYNNQLIKNKILRKVKKIIVYSKKLILGDKEIKQFEKVIFMGGGYINSLWSNELKEIFFLALMAKRNKCKLYFTGQTSGPYNNLVDKFLAKTVYKIADGVTVREKNSFNLLKSYGVNNLNYGVDDFYLFDINNKIKSKNYDKYFILNIKKFENYDEGIEKIVQLAKNINKKTGFNIALVPFGKGKRSADLECSKKISTILSEEKINNFIVDVNSLDDIIDVFSNAEFTLGMAYHSLVISLYFNKSAIALYDGEYYKSKITGILSHYKLENQAYNFREITNENLDSVTLDIMKKINSIDLDVVSNRTKEMRMICKRTWDYILNT